jgi:hypothetical protein
VSPELKPPGGRPAFYRLDGHTPVPCEFVEYCPALGDESRIVGRTETGGHVVSTIFIGIDYSYGVGPRPLTFETMVFDPLDEHGQMRF